MSEKTDNHDRLDMGTGARTGQAEVNKFLIDDSPAAVAEATPAKVDATAPARVETSAAIDKTEAVPKAPPLTVSQGGTPVPGTSLSAEQLEVLTNDIVAAIKTVYDPEIPTDVYELGLIYKIDISDERDVTVDMTLTAPGCPVAGEMPVWVENAVASVAGVGDVYVNLTFDPPWEMSMMSDEAKVALNIF